MNNKRGFSSLTLVGIAAVVLIIGGGAYFYFNQPATTPAESQNQEPATQTQTNTDTSNKYSLSAQKKLATTANLVATIDSTIITAPYPKFTGTVSGSMTNLLGMNLYQKEPTYHGYYSGNVNISNGQWSASLETQLPAGTYIVDMYVLDGHSDFGNNNVVTTATLTVK